MLTEICAELRNYFLRDCRKDIHAGTFTVSDGSIGPLSFLKNGQYFRIAGSVFNDGVYKYGEEQLTDEVFTGAVWAMSVPPDVVALDAEIEAWIAKNKDALEKPYQSESFDGYSYSKASGRAANGSNAAYGWQDQFAGKLNRYRRAFIL